MTEALDAMVKAMAAEIERQEAADAAYRAENPWVEATDATALNLEKVARAGLLSIREPTDAMYKVATWEISTWIELIDAILNDKPRTA